jgi:hypothetical protein
MAGKKKDFTTADGAIDKMFSTASVQSNDRRAAEESSKAQIQPGEETANNTEHTHVTHIADVKKPTNVSKHYDERGKRDVRLALLLDEQLREDLNLLYKATNSKSLNDLIITVLLDYVESEENQAKLKQYRNLLGL